MKDARTLPMYKVARLLKRILDEEEIVELRFGKKTWLGSCASAHYKLEGYQPFKILKISWKFKPYPNIEIPIFK